MKKIVTLFAIVALASCGTGTSTEVKSDSTTVIVDSTAVVTDTTAKIGGAVEELPTEGKVHQTSVEHIK
jgi:hypothetical protein